MHDKNGTRIVDGAFVKLTTYVAGEQRTVVAQVIQTKPGSDTCNLSVAVPYPTIAVREEWATAKDVEVVPT